jgi:hypothetical protein
MHAIHFFFKCVFSKVLGFGLCVVVLIAVAASDSFTQVTPK